MATRSLPLEERMTVLETEFRTELKHLATKEDMRALETRLVKWMIGAVATSALLGAALVTAIDRLLG